ncbi:PaaJ Acetyl-CoA acetyltransferase [Candidatus Planktophila versatilis]|uniref:acetyl-CoA C-acetyltransferase n=1 Tax=Candidatus Planktophila versatilis TaxID=1884905 RepID=UPI003BEEC175
MSDAVIVAVSRSPIGRAYKGSFANMRADDLLLQIAREVLAQVPEFDATQLDDILLGCSLAGGEQGFNLGRVLAVRMGLDGVPGTTVNRFCASSLQTTRMAFHSIRAGESRAVLSLGLECVSRLIPNVPDDYSLRNEVFVDLPASPSPWVDPRDHDLMPDVHMSMGQTAENVASIYSITRNEMDEFALRSQQLTLGSAMNGFWDIDITPVRLSDGTLVGKDDGPRPESTLEGLTQLKPIFLENGTVTAGNCCGLNDGAAGVLVMSADYARELGITPLARIVSSAVSGLSPEIMGLGPIEASRRALQIAGLNAADIDQIEINEAFAAQVIPCYRELDFPLERVNINGGAIAIGHPYGMTGARITTTMINSLKFHDQEFGLETMCVAGGMGMAMIFQRLS